MDLLDRVIVCGTCEGGAAFAKALHAAGVQGVETADCLSLCARPVSLALRGPGKDMYLFAGLDPNVDIADAVALAALWRAAPGGTITDARPAGRLRMCLVGRVPA